jgi:hypothetical protein
MLEGVTYERKLGKKLYHVSYMLSFFAKGYASAP